VESTQVDANRNGIRANFFGYLGKARIPMQIDFGFSDELTSTAIKENFPTLLKGMPGPKIKSYPVESVVAEKFHDMERYVDIPSRWKDYYDLWLISENFEIIDHALQKAISKTFQNRETKIPPGRPASLTVNFALQHQDGWKTFLKKSDLENDEISDLTSVVEKLWMFLGWPLQCASKESKNDQGSLHWIPTKQKWV
jgi:hypothetical protein